MGGKSTKVAPSNVIEVIPQQQTSLENSQTFNSSCARQESSASSSSFKGQSRPTSQISKRPLSQISRYSGKFGLSHQASRPNKSRLDSRKMGDRLSDTFQPTRVDQIKPSDLTTSFRSTHFLNQKQQQIQDTKLPCDSSFDEENTYVMKLINPELQTTINCPSCNGTFSGMVHIPYLLLCGHSFCSGCFEIAFKSDPSFLKCGLCGVNTPVEPQSGLDDLIINEAILDLVNSKEFAFVSTSFAFDRCAECERNNAVFYCNDCSASYCEMCNKQQHTGSKVRAKHKPVSINLKPRPQPTCKKHPGQSCVLYCETECQPMCVLCKFYGQHKFHTYQLLNNSAAAYRNVLSSKLAQVIQIENDMQEVAQEQSKMVSEIRKKAKDSQEKLEKFFSETRNEVIAALEHREAMLLCLLDKQVEIQEKMLQHQRINLATARSRMIAAKEEGTRLLELNPTSTLFSRKHVDSAMDNVLKQTERFSSENVDSSCQKNHILPVGLRPKQELTSKLQQILNQHGLVLQLPEQPVFVEVKVQFDKSIYLQWEIPDQKYHEVMSDGTRSFSLHCFVDVPFKFKKDKLQNFNRHLLHVKRNSTGLSTADSGYQDGASDDTTSQVSTLPSIPAPLRTSSSYNVSLITMQATDKCDSKIDENVARTSTNQIRPKSSIIQSNQAAHMLNLPPLITTTTEELFDDGTDKEMSVQTQNSSQASSSSSSQSSLTDESNSNCVYEGINIGCFCQGYAFEEIYYGQKNKFCYSGVVSGATYYFRVQCRNNVGEGPWSDTYKCKINPSLPKRNKIIN